MPQASAVHRVAIVAAGGIVPFDLVTPGAVFGCVRLPGGRPGYRVRVCGTAKEVETGAFRIRVRYGLGELARADTIVLPGVADLGARVPARLVSAVRLAAARGTRVASICSGSFLLAATGVSSMGGARRRTGSRRASWRAAIRGSASSPTCSTSTRAGFSPRPVQLWPSI